jgi:hypothetical protein
MRFPADRKRRALIACGIYVLTVAVFFAFAARATLTTHTPWNHFALLAEAWLDGRLDLGGPPPAYTGNNDFSQYQGKWYVAFPPFPAVLLLPLVKVAGSATDVRDGQFFIWLAGVAPAVLFLAFEKLRRTGRSSLSERHHVGLSLLFAFGSVYFFCAEQGTVWYAAHVVGAALAALYLLFALEAERPVLAGVALGLGFATRTPLLFAAPLFLIEAVRVALPDEVTGNARELLAKLDRKRAALSMAYFAVPIACVLALTLWYNAARFGDPFEVGYRYLSVVWQRRIEHWGLFSYHYLARNLGVVLTSLPWWVPEGTPAPFQINAHGLALWVTTPLYLWLLWPRRTSSLHAALWLTVIAVALPTLFYQNTGWVQFGYRFSNDYAVFLFALLAIGNFRMRALFAVAAVWCVVINAFGAYTFGRSEFQRFYYQDNSQKILYQPD